MKTFTVSEHASKGFTFQSEGPAEYVGVPIGQSILKEMQDFAEAGQDTSIWNMVDVVQDGDMLRLIREQNVRDKRAIVHVATPPGVGGTIKLFANTVTETYDEKKGRVLREADAFPPPGVKLLSEKPAEGGFGPEFLIEMMPGSSFRIVRSGQLYDSSEKKNAPPELVVLWNGRWDGRAEFNNFRNPDPDKFTAYLKGQLRKSDFNKNEWDSFRYKENPMKFWGLSVYTRGKRHGEV